MYATLATVALLATSSLVQAAGKAVVVNACSYNVFVANTPAANGGFSEIDLTLAPGATYQQSWTQLTNGNGWSIKLSQNAGKFGSDIMQYEYTFHNDGIIWYDLSDVDGNPWNGNWEITASSPSSSCTPLQQAYRYSTDDAYGMQACPDDSTITVTLCSGDNAAAASSAVSSASIKTTASSSTKAATSSASVSASSTAIQTTTFATVKTATVSVATTNTAGATTTQVATATITNVVTSTHWHHSHFARHATRAAHANE